MSEIKADVQARMAHARSVYTRNGNLTSSEIEQLVSWEFIEGLMACRDLVQYYCLKAKNRNPVAAERLLKEVGLAREQGEEEVNIVMSLGLAVTYWLSTPDNHTARLD